MNDETEAIRRQQLAEINAQPGSREALEAEHGQVWDTQELGRDFNVEGFMAPYVVVRRKTDGQRERSCSSTIRGFISYLSRTTNSKGHGISGSCACAGSRRTDHESQRGQQGHDHHYGQG